MRSNSLENRVIIVAGAGSGMGNATVNKLIALGCVVHACDWNAESLKSLEHHENCVTHHMDIQDSKACDQVVQTVVGKDNRIDGLVNFAGVLKRTGILSCTDEEFDYVFKVNVYGCFYMLRAVAQKMVNQGFGSIVNVSSIWSDIGASGVIAYCASKGAVSQLTRSAALDLAGTGVRVNEIRPGETNTPMLASERGRALSQSEIKDKLNEIAQSIPVRRLASPDEIADAAIFLLSDSSSYMTGSHITVDGGYTAR